MVKSPLQQHHAGPTLMATTDRYDLCGNKGPFLCFFLREARALGQGGQGGGGTQINK